MLLQEAVRTLGLPARDDIVIVAEVSSQLQTPSNSKPCP